MGTAISTPTTSNPLYSAHSSNLGEFTDWSFRKGEFIQNWPQGISFRPRSKDRDGIPDDVLQNADGILIFSRQLIAALDELGVTDIQYLPVEVYHFDGKSIPGYAIANLTTMVPALDLERSKFHRFPDDFFVEWKRGNICALHHTALKSAALQGFNVVRLKECATELLISDAVQRIFLENKFTGMDFYKVEIT